MRSRNRSDERNRRPPPSVGIGAVVAIAAATCIVGGCLSGGVPVRRSMVNPSPPDLTNCTRIEVKYYPSTSEALRLSAWSSILSADESWYLGSLKTIVVDKPRRIRAIAERLRSGSYKESEGVVDLLQLAEVICYRGEERLVSFETYGSLIRTQDGHYFAYERSPVAVIDVIPQVYPLLLRGICANNLYCMGVDLRTMASEGVAWPGPHEWCDVLLRRRLAKYPTAAERFARELVCPAAGEGKCHYAMNPRCTYDSPPDTVLLFETKAGWNQHGGPELFTFDNHDPKGGLVLLNDGTVKFIRTEEELKQLRWK
jgi:hypothetical protein